MMKFDHIVNYNGVYYAAGEEVPIDETPVTVVPNAELDKNEEIPQSPKRRGRQPRKE